MYTSASCMAVAVAVAGLSLVAAQRERVLHAFSGSTPQIDGVLEPGEWADADVWPGIQDWMSEFLPIDPGSSPVDLAADIWMKHDATRLYFAFNITDDVLFRYDAPTVPVWLPSGNPSADNLTQQGWPWFGDEVEVLLNPSNTWSYPNQSVNGSGLSWQMVVNTGKSRLGGLGKGGLLEGEPRASNYAWANYQSWILSGHMTASVGVYKASNSPTGLGGSYVIEWGVDFNPCVELFPGIFYDPEAFPYPLPIGMNIAVGDVDTEADSQGNIYGLRHEQWFNGTKDSRTDLWQFGTLWLEPGPKPQTAPQRAT